MKKYLIKMSNSQSSPTYRDGLFKEARIEVNLNELESDPGLRKKSHSIIPTIEIKFVGHIGLKVPLNQK